MDLSTAPLTIRRQPSATAVLLVAAFGAFLAFLDSTIVNIAFPNIQQSFPTYAIGSLSWILNSYNIVFAAFLVAALLVPASLALVVEGFDIARGAHGVGLWGSAAAIASGLGPPIGGAIVQVSNWRWAFLVNVPLGIVAV